MGVLGEGLVGYVEWVADQRHAATAWGSGAVPVFATPSLVALVEAAAVAALEGHLSPDDTSVGTRIDLAHLAATPLGEPVRAEARLAQVDGRRLVFEVVAHDGTRKIGEGRHERMVVNRERFLAKLGRR